MFVGHFGAGLATKKVAPAISLATAFLAVQWLDLVWPVLVLAGIEKVEILPAGQGPLPLSFTFYPYSHSLLAAIVWAVLIGGIYFMVKRDRNNSIIVGILVVSHWVLDLLVHVPDLPLTPFGETRVGMGLWNYKYPEFIGELILYLAGAYYYLKATKPTRLLSNIVFWSLIVFLLVIHVANSFGPPPPSVTAVGIAGLSQWLIIAWAWWTDKLRIASPQSNLA